MGSVVEEIRAEGRGEGRIEGRREGRAEGIREEKTDTALQLLRMGKFSLQDIADITRLGLDEVRVIAEKHGG